MGFLYSLFFRYKLEINNMSFLFGGSKSSKKEIDAVLQTIQGNDEQETATCSTGISFCDNECYGYYKINIFEFFKDIYANVRPKSLEIKLKNASTTKIESIDVFYLHTPICDEDLEPEMLDSFTNHVQFTVSATIKNPQPYMTICQLDNEGNIIDIDLSQITNVNITPNKSNFVSLGALIFRINRIDDGDVLLNLDMNLVHTTRKY